MPNDIFVCFLNCLMDTNDIHETINRHINDGINPIKNVPLLKQVLTVAIHISVDHPATPKPITSKSNSTLNMPLKRSNRIRSNLSALVGFKGCVPMFNSSKSKFNDIKKKQFKPSPPPKPYLPQSHTNYLNEYHVSCLYIK